MLKLENKDIKTVITAIYHTFRDLSREDREREKEIQIKPLKEKM